MVREELKQRSRELQQTPLMERIAAMGDLFRAAAEEAQQIRHLPAWASKEIAAQGLYRFALPPELAGEDTRARQQIEAVEAVSAIDGSVGWCTHINSEINSLVIRKMSREAEEIIFDDWDVLICAGVGPGLEHAKARNEGDGWRLWCQGAFGSGCHNATWTLVHTRADGVPTEDGGSSDRAFLIPRQDFEIIDTWDTAGLRGSGSHDVRINGALIPEALALPKDLFGPCEKYANPTFRNPTQAHYNKAAVALGICRGAIDEFSRLAQAKTPWGSGSLLKDQPQIQYRIGEAEANLRSARAFLLEAQEGLEDHLGPLPKDGGRARPEFAVLRLAMLACTHAAQASRAIVDLIHNTSGTTGSRMDSPLERKLRDAHQAAAHAAISYRNYEQLGKTFLGHAPAAVPVDPRA
ncbi:MAG: acyl-CoA dehydrogenase family protein [Dehalococcoidia bacterium]